MCPAPSSASSTCATPFQGSEALCQVRNTLVARLLFPEKTRQRFQATVNRDARFGLTLRTIGQVEVFEFDLIKAIHDLRAEFVTEFPLFGEGR